MRSTEAEDPSPSAGRRQYLTVLFSDLSGSTRLGAQLEAEDFAEMLGRLRVLCRKVIARHGGQIARIQSDGVLAIFGYDGVREDDGRRAAEAALDLHQSINEIAPKGARMLPEALKLHSGIHAGVCFVDRGDEERGRFEVLGDVPNMAARLSDMAGPGDVCISEETLGPGANFFEIRDKQFASIKGRATPLSVVTLVGRANARTRFEAGAARGLAPFVGRELETRELQACLGRTLRGAPQCVTVVGNPGVGKTRLLEEFVRRVADQRCLVLRGFCESYLSAEPLQPFLQILRDVHARGSGDVDALAQRAFQPAMPLIRSSAEAASTAVDILRNAFEAVAAEVPVLLVVDDWQWADDTSVQIVDAIRAARRPIFVLLASREPEAGQLNGVRGVTLPLAGLTLEAVSQSVGHLVPGANPFLIADIHRDSGGNPLFVEELCHSAAIRGVERPSEKLFGSSAWLASLIESRVARLGSRDAQVVRCASVIGNLFPRWLLAQVSGVEVDDDQVHALALQDFIYPAEQNDMLRFKHGVTREVVYASVGSRERVATHLKVARALDQRSGEEPRDDILEMLAYHYAEGMLAQEAARFSELAGDKAMAAHALDRARLQYAATLAALDKIFAPDRAFLLRWCAVAQKLGMACVFDALAFTDAERLLKRAVELAHQSQEPPVIARAEYWLAYTYYAKGRGREALQHCRRALAAAEQLDDARLLAQLQATLGQICASVCRYEEAISLLDAAIDSKRARGRRGSSVAVGSAFSLAIKGSVLGDQGRFMEAQECFSEMLQLLEGSGHQVVSSVRNWMGVVYLWQGRWADAVAAVESSMLVAENVKSHLLLAISRAIWGYGNWRLDASAVACQAVRDGTSWIEMRGGMLGASLNYGWLLDMADSSCADSGRRRHAAILLRLARRQDRLGEAMGCRALARAAAEASDWGAAEHYLRLAERSAEARGSRHEQAATLLCRAEVCLLQDQRLAAAAQLDAASEAFTSMRMDWHLQQAQRLRERL